MKKIIYLVMILITSSAIAQTDVRLLEPSVWANHKPGYLIGGISFFEHPEFMTQIQKIMPLENWDHQKKFYNFNQPIQIIDNKWLVVIGQKKAEDFGEIVLLFEITSPKVVGHDAWRIKAICDSYDVMVHEPIPGGHANVMVFKTEYQEVSKNYTKDYQMKRGCADGFAKLAVERWLETQPKETSNPLIK